MEITISGEDKERLRQVKDLAKRLGLKVRDLSKKEKLKENKSEKLYQLMEEAATSGDIFSVY